MQTRKTIVARHRAISDTGEYHLVDECRRERIVQGLSSFALVPDRWFELNGQDLTEQEDGWLQQDYPPLRLRLLEPPATS